jgi:hypothetical protein
MSWGGWANVNDLVSTIPTEPLSFVIRLPVCFPLKPVIPASAVGSHDKAPQKGPKGHKRPKGKQKER